MIVRLDMSEYMEKHTVSKMIGAPPGYVGFEQGGNLTEIVRSKPFSIILLDEVEKAHPDVFNSLLQIMEDGRLTDGKGRTVDFKNTILIMTSNVGSEILRKSEIGFGDKTVKSSQDQKVEFESRVKGILQNTFKPEFLNRIDEIVIFNSLSREDIKVIASRMIRKTGILLEDQGITLTVDKKAQEYFAENGFSEEYGARPLRRLIQRELENKLSSMLISGDLKSGDDVRISADTSGVKIDVKSQVSVSN
jgi:ATP-dependent Clp protease ATP-binding subunit ClpC